MKKTTYLLLATGLALFTACGKLSDRKRYSPCEEQRVAHEYLTKANNADGTNSEQRMAMYDKAIYHFANIVVCSDANDTLRADALFTLRWIEAYVRHDYELALQYLNQYLELVGPDHESYPACLAYKADDLWHFGAQDSALHYAYKALAAPHTTDDGIEYICHHILWNIYDSRAMLDSANHHKSLHMKIRDSRVFEPMSMEQLKNQLQASIISPKEENNNDSALIVAIVITVLFTGLCIAYRATRHRFSQKSPRNIADNSSNSLTQAQRLCLALVEGHKTFEQTSVFRNISTMQINERELPDINNETTRAIERTLLDTFSEACRVLLASGDLNDQELICSLGMYLGYSNTILAYLGHTTTATIRKRKERIRKKLSTELYEALVGVVKQATR